MSAISPRDDENKVGWISGPDGRGTMDLVWSCVITLGLCVWNALHLNIPPKGETKIQYWIRNIRWVIMGILAPELVVYIAWRQWNSARALTREIKGILQDEDKRLAGDIETVGRSASMITNRRHAWTNMHSYYAVMGGFVFETAPSSVNNSAFIPDIPRLTVTAHGVILLAECGYLPDIDPDDIKDKSKADALAKAIVMVQATWFIIQVIARLVTHLPVSLLEVNTLSHVLCALLIYLLWWDKPREVGQATILAGDWANQLCAFMYMSSRISGTRIRRVYRPREWIVPEFKNLVYVDPERKKENPHPIHAETWDPARGFRRDSNTIPLRNLHQDPIMYHTPAENSNSDYGEFVPQYRHQDTLITAKRKAQLRCDTDDRDMDPPHIRTARRRLAAQAFCQFPAVHSRFSKLPDSLDGHWEPPVKELVVKRAGNWPSDYLLKSVSGIYMGMALWFATMGYGGVHMAAWFDYFPSEAERTLWHLSSGFIASSGFFWFAANLIGWLFPAGKRWYDNFVLLKNHWIEYVFLLSGAACCGTLYVLSRLYLIAEAVISLREVPAEIYQTVDWTIFIPHF